MSGPSWCSTPFDVAATPRSCFRSKVPTFGISLSMTNLRSAMASSHERRLHARLSYDASRLGAIRDVIQLARYVAPGGGGDFFRRGLGHLKLARRVDGRRIGDG